MATLALGIPSLVGGGKLSQASDRLNSHGSVDRRRLFTWCGGAGGFEVLIANRKSQNHCNRTQTPEGGPPQACLYWSGTRPVARARRVKAIQNPSREHDGSRQDRVQRWSRATQVKSNFTPEGCGSSRVKPDGHCRGVKVKEVLVPPLCRFARGSTNCR